MGAVILTTALISLTSNLGAQKRSGRGPGQLHDNSYLLPNGWRLTPAGEQIQVQDLPLAIVLHPDGRHLLVSNNGAGSQSIDLLDLRSRKVAGRAAVDYAWLGLALSPKGDRVYAGGGMSNSILQFSLQNLTLAPMSPIRLGNSDESIYPGGLCLSGDRLYSVNNLGNNVTAIELATGKPLGTVAVGDHPYTCVASADRRTIYVSVWGQAEIAAMDASALQVAARIPTDDHPNAMAFSSDGRRLFVANANTNTVSDIELASGKTLERISVALYPNSPAGSTTNALALSPDGRRLFAANADNNDVAVIDVSKAGRSKVLGFIPVGWYPTALAVSADGKTLYVANGQGTRSYPNPDEQYLPEMLHGTVSVIPMPGDKALAAYTAQVYRNVPYTEKTRLAVPFGGKSAVPRRVGDRSPIKYVIYVVRENRTYDQVMGDMKEGNGDPKLTIFGEEVTPNTHALAREFVLLDNFYANAEVSADGHNWSMGAYATDYVEKTWPSVYSGRRKGYDFEGASAIAVPSAGYIWDACKRAGVTYRSYGEFVLNGRMPGDAGRARLPGLEGHIDPLYRGWDLNYSDLDRTKRFLSELHRFEQEGSLPQFQIVRLGNDHTRGTSPGALTPRAYLAQNDFALGQLVEGVSKSKFWSSTAIFVVEDDAQDGPDHVDGHRTVALVISPYARRRGVDSTMYSTASMLRTMELILGVAPMSQYDAGATPMFSSLGDIPDETQYSAIEPKISLSEVNPEDAPGAQRSMMFDFDEADEAPDLEFNEIIWKSVKGRDSVMPAPVRAAFIRPVPEK